MKESELMKEVVRRSVEPDLEDASMRIIEDHEFTSDHPTATVTTSYLTRIVAAFAIVFALGLIAGLIIMKGVLRKDPPVNTAPNTAPDIIDTISGSSDNPSQLPNDTVSQNNTQIVTTPYLDYYGQRFYLHSNSGLELSFSEMKHSAMSTGMLKYLSSFTFVGLVCDNKEYITSNAVPVGSAVFLSPNRETFYVVCNDDTYLRFGRAEVPDLPDNDPQVISVEMSSFSKSSTYIEYNGRTYYVNPLEERNYTRQNQLFFTSSDIQDMLKDSIFIGRMTGALYYNAPMIYGLNFPAETVIFYNAKFRKFFVFYYNDGKYVFRDFMICGVK